MEALLLAAIAAVIVFFVLALFTRGGAGETIHARPAQTPLGEGELPRRLEKALVGLGYRVEQIRSAEGGRTDLTAVDSRPLAGQRLYARTFEKEVVGVAEVQAALDRLKEGFHKAVLVSSAGFSDEARSTAMDSAVELLTPDALELLMPGAPTLRRPLGPPLPS